jgi:hypothetical protein
MLSNYKLIMQSRKVVAVAAIASMLLSDVAFALDESGRACLAPPLAANPICRIEKAVDGRYKIVENIISRPPQGEINKRWAFFELSYLIADALRLRITQRALIPLIEKYFQGRGVTLDDLASGDEGIDARNILAVMLNGNVPGCGIEGYAIPSCETAPSHTG